MVIIEIVCYNIHLTVFVYVSGYHTLELDGHLSQIDNLHFGIIFPIEAKIAVALFP